MGRKVVRGDASLRGGFLFLGNHVILDFLNTRLVIDEKTTELLPDFKAWIRWLRAAGLLEERDVAPMKAAWDRMGRKPHPAMLVRGLRETLRADILAWEQGGAVRARTVERLNRTLQEHPMLARLRTQGSGFVTERWFRPRRTSDLFAPLAHWAMDLFVNADPSRVRKCDNCVLHFCDASKKGQRRWCSMKMCGNRHKVWAYAERRRGKA